MKKEMSKRTIRRNYKKIICVGYCNLQYLLNANEPFAYSTRLEGWACDYYEIPREIVVSTGYSPIGVHVDYDLLKSYDDAARQICNETWDLETRKRRLDALLADFAGEVEAKVFC